MSRARQAPAAPARSRRTAPFPLRVGAIDIGSSAMRFVGVRFASAERSEVLLSLRAPVRLGHGVFLTGRLAPRAVDAAIQALVAFRGEMERLHIGNVRAVATSAVRESENAAEFVERALREAGIEVETISGSEEARLVHLAVRRRLQLGRRRWVLADLGGGSIEVSLADANGILWTESHTMGAVRLLEELSERGQDPASFERLVTEYVSTLRLPRADGRRPPAGLIATGGNIEALAALAGLSVGAHGAVLTREALQRMIGVLSRLSYRQRVDELGLREDRADVILPAALVYERIVRLVDAREIHVPFVGLKDGLLIDLVDRLAVAGHEEQRRVLIREGALALGRRYAFDEPHGRQVMRLALDLFDQLRSVHGLGPRERGLLLAAGLLHDVGTYISFKRHHRHSLYLLSQSELPGLTPREMLVMANVARYHRKSEPRASHEEFARLDEAERRCVVRLAALLRLADALDRDHTQRVRGVRARVSGREARVVVSGAGDLLLERWALRRKAQLFERTFNVRLRLRGEGGGR